MEGKVSIFFIDANVIMYTVGKEHKYKRPCSLLVERIAKENITVASDTEVLQEILYRYWFDKIKGIKRIDPIDLSMKARASKGSAK